jgi:hypothetical protein
MANTKTTGATGSVSKEGIYQYSVPYYVETAGECLSVGKDSYVVTGVTLNEVSRSWECLNNGTAKPGYILTVVYEGGATSGDQASANESFDLDFQTLEVPIESHWNFEEIKKKYGGYQDPDDSSRWIFADYEAGKENTKQTSPMKGVTTYMVLHCTVSKNYSARSLPKGALSDVGKWTNNVPGLDSSVIDTQGRNWLKMPTKATLRGSLWEISESWKLSEKQVWPEEVYKKG